VDICYSVDGQAAGCLLVEQVNETTWRAKVPGQEAGSEVEIQFKVVDKAGNVAEETLIVHIKAEGETKTPGGEKPAAAAPGAAPITIAAAVAIPTAVGLGLAFFMLRKK